MQVPAYADDGYDLISLKIEEQVEYEFETGAFVGSEQTDGLAL